ncbi:ADP-ribosylation factor GTPase-activating protein effector protein 2 [Diutina catenulata]
MSALPSSRKTHQEKHKQIFRQLLREDANKSCADCKSSKNPRWASWSLGCFLCIRCSGIHRGMGTHISKVKSVDLDAWTDDQVENMIKWGNAKVNAYWEAKLPANYVPDQSKIDGFIKTKYDLKKWVASTAVPDPLAMKTPKPSSAAPPAQPAQPAVASHQEARPKQSSSASLLDDIFSTPSPPVPPKQQAPSQRPPPLQRAPTGPQSAQSTGGSLNSRPDLKKSILSLYSSPSASNSFVSPQPSHNTYQQRSQSQNSVNSVANSLQGLNFGSNPAATSTPVQQVSSTPQQPPATPQHQPRQPPQQQQWANEWADAVPASYNTPAPVKSSFGSNGLDSDLFKNVWD